VNVLLLLLLLFSALSSTLAREDAFHSGASSAIIAARLFQSQASTTITAVKYALNGNVVVAGWSVDASLQPRAPGLWQTKASSTEAFVAVLTPSLDKVLAWTFIGGTQADVIHSLAVASSGDVAVVGTTNSPDLHTTSGAFNQVHGGSDDGFIVVLSSDLDSLRFCSYIGGTGNDNAYGIACDAGRDFVVVGQTGSRSTFTTVNAYRPGFVGGESDAFVMKFSPSGSVVFSTLFGSLGADAFRAVTVADDGTIVATGWTGSETFETWPRRQTPWDWNAPRPFGPTFKGGISDAVVVAFVNDGSRLVFSSFLGGSESESGTAILVTEAGRIVVVGETNSPDFPVNVNSNHYKGQRDIFVTFVNGDGRQMISSQLYGGMGHDVPCFAGKMSNEQVQIVGWSGSEDLALNAEGSNSELRGESDVLVLRVATNSVLYAGRFGWGGADRAIAAIMDEEGDLIIAGSSTSTITSLGDRSYTASTFETAFISRFVFGAVELTNPRGGDKWCQGHPVTLTWNARNMLASDSYSIQIAEPGQGNWQTVVPPQAGVKATWNPSTDLPGSMFDFRLVARRGHEMRTLEPVVIRVPASVMLSPASTVDCAGRKVVLTVTAEGSDLQWQWRKNGRAIAGATGPQFVIDAVDGDSEGRYDVQVTSSCGNPVTSAPAVVSVAPLTAITSDLQDRSIQSGATLRLAVLATGADLTYSWYHAGALLEGRAGHILEIPNASAVHRGIYRAVVNGTCGTVTSRDAFVAIDGTTSVASSTESATLWLSSNPVQDVLAVRTSRDVRHAHVLDMLGRTVSHADVGNHDEWFTVSAHVGSVPSGNYMLVLTGATSVNAIPFVIQR